MNNQAKTKASKCLRALLNGKTLNRKILGNMKIAINNDSLHSYMSYLRNERLIPIERIKKDDGTCDYFMFPEEITRYNDPMLKKIQRVEMKLIVEQERQQKLLNQFLKFIKRLVEFPELWVYWDELPFR